MEIFLLISILKQKKVLTEIIIDEPKSITKDSKEYSFKINYLKAFGSGATPACQSQDSLNFKMVQNSSGLKLYYKDLVNAPVTSVKLYMETIGSQKRLSHLEVNSATSKVKIQYNKSCTKIQ